MVSDQTLVDQAGAVAEVRVTGIEPAPVEGRPATDYVVEVERLVKGHLPGSTVVVRVPGGVRPDGVGLKVFGAPELHEGETALLFLRPAEDGTYRLYFVDQATGELRLAESDDGVAWRGVGPVDAPGYPNNPSVARAPDGPKANARVSFFASRRRSIVSESTLKSLLTAFAESMAITRLSSRVFSSPNMSITRPFSVKGFSPFDSTTGFFISREKFRAPSNIAESPVASTSVRSIRTSPTAKNVESPSPTIVLPSMTTGGNSLPNESFSM